MYTTCFLRNSNKNSSKRKCELQRFGQGLINAMSNWYDRSSTMSSECKCTVRLSLFAVGV